MANMFLCTFTSPAFGTPDQTFYELLVASPASPHEVAKLEMFIHYFERIAAAPPVGQVKIFRQVSRMGAERWAEDDERLSAVDVRPRFESLCTGAAERCVLADFANQFIGGGCVQGPSHGPRRHPLSRTHVPAQELCSARVRQRC